MEARTTRGCFTPSKSTEDEKKSEGGKKEERKFADAIVSALVAIAQPLILLPSLPPSLLFRWVPRPERLSRAATKEAIGRSMKRMDTTQLDLLQFHWWEYGYPYYMDALQYLQEIQQDGGIRHLALTNFDTKHMNEIYDAGIKIVSNQVQYSLLDQRPSVLMAPAMLERNMQILAYGTLLGGFFSENWKGKDDPKGFETVSQQKYYNMIRTWGDWGLFQELLLAMDKVAKKHEVSISNVAVRWVLEQPAVGGAIVGCRFGLKGKEHAEDNKRVFSFKLDEEDKMELKAVTSKAKDLMKVIGDCGGEYRRA
jgi:aryl-alcohol dehydrogenase-like predicted oxidoreductase